MAATTTAAAMTTVAAAAECRNNQNWAEQNALPFIKLEPQKNEAHFIRKCASVGFLYALRNLLCGRRGALFLFAALEASDYVIGTDFTAVTEIVEMLVL